MEFKATFTTTESRTFAVPFISMPAVRALLRSVSGIHKQNMLSKSFSLVTEKLLKLVERPVIELAVELFASSLLNSDLAQIFKSKSVTNRLSSPDIRLSLRLADLVPLDCNSFRR